MALEFTRQPCYQVFPHPGVFLDTRTKANAIVFDAEIQLVFARVDCFPAGAAFPKWQEGRHPHCHYRGLLRLHTRYGPPDRSAAQGDLCREAPTPTVARPGRSPASGPIDNYPGEILPH